MAHRILIADPDEAFGLMLKQTLELSEAYAAEHVTSGAHALASLEKVTPDLAIIDLTLADMPPQLLIQKLQQAAPAVRVMLIPIGDGLPDDMQDVAIHGVLTKPFFVGDLGDQIAAALGVEAMPLVTLPPPPDKKLENMPKPRVRQTVQPPARTIQPIESQPAPTPPARQRPKPRAVTQTSAPPSSSPPPPTTSPAPRVRQIVQPTTRSSASPRRAVSRPPETKPTADSHAAIDKILSRLAQETRADAIVVLRNGAFVTQRGTFPAARIEAFVELIVRWSQVAAETAAFVGETYRRFPQMHLEGERYHVYATDQGNGIVVVVVSRTDVTVGTVRLHTKAAAAEIAKQLR